MSATYMRLEKRPVCRLFSPLPERPIQASNNHCSNTTAYLYTFYQKFKPHSKKHRTHPPLFPHPVHPVAPQPESPASPTRIPREGGGPRPPPESPAHPPESPAHPPKSPAPPVSPAKAGAHAAHRTTKRPTAALPDPYCHSERSEESKASTRQPDVSPQESPVGARRDAPHPGHSAKPPSFPPAHPSFPRSRESRLRNVTNPRNATHSNPREGGGTPPPRHSPTPSVIPPRPPSNPPRRRGPPHPSFRPHSVIPAKAGIHPLPAPFRIPRATPPNPPRRRGPRRPKGGLPCHSERSRVELPFPRLSTHKECRISGLG